MSAATAFALGTFVDVEGDTFGALVIGDAVHPLPDGASVRTMVEGWKQALPTLQGRANSLQGRSAPYRLGELRPMAPVQPVGQIFQAGANYRAHVLELLAGAQARGDHSDGAGPAERAHARRALDQRARDGEPFVFSGTANAVVGARDDVILPDDFHQHDWELELVAVIGRRARRVARADALDYVAGYTIANDLTMRDALRRSDVPGGIDWLRAKNAPTFLPIGPLLVPSVHAGDPMNMQIELTLNGRVMQQACTSDMLFDVARLIEYVSTISELRPGDLLLTGSPSGNGAHHGVFLSPGDELEGTITGLGLQHNRCCAERISVTSVAEAV